MNCIEDSQKDCNFIACPKHYYYLSSYAEQVRECKASLSSKPIMGEQK